MSLRSLIPWRQSEESSINRIQDEMDRFLGAFGPAWMESPFSPLRRENGWKTAFPAADLAEDESSVTIRAEIPGMNEKEIDISIVENVLILKGEKKEEKETKEKGSYRSERYFGSFERRIGLPAEVDVAKTNATYKDGVLTVQMPKTPKAKAATKKIEVKAG